jgi:hypothetical protein
LEVDDEDFCAEEETDGDSLNIDEPEGFRMGTSGQWNKSCPDFAHDHILEISAPESVKTGSHSLDDEMPVSRAFKFFTDIQLALIIFLTLCWLYDHV